jgi:hypothetical protein
MFSIAFAKKHRSELVNHALQSKDILIPQAFEARILLVPLDGTTLKILGEAGAAEARVSLSTTRESRR